MKKKGWVIVGVVASILVVGGFVILGFLLHWNQEKMGEVLPWNQKEIGTVLDTYQGVPVYENGLNYTQSYGKNYSKDGYYYGQKWQCVEFVKRFFYDAKGHKMPNVYGNAKDFFDGTLPQGAYNSQRGLYQFRNGGYMKPAVDDLVVFQNSLFGHVAIITRVSDNEIEVIQQNIYASPRETYKLEVKNGNYIIGNGKSPVGWLRKINPNPGTIKG